MKRLRMGRRAMLRGLGGVAMGMPALEAMFEGKAAAQPLPRRYVVCFTGTSLGGDGDPVHNDYVPSTVGPNYDLKSSLSEGQPFYTPPGDGSWSRHVADGWSRIWDLAKPVIAQVHGYAMAGGTELMAACDLVYIAEDAQLSYPVVRVVSPPDFQYHVWLVGMRPAMEMMLTGDAIDGREAVRIGMANRAFPTDALERETLAMAARVASIPSDLLQINKRTVHRAMEFKGVRTATRAGSELQGLASNLETSKQFFGGDLSAAVKQAAQKE